MTVQRTIELTDLDPSELAELFCEMDGERQAEFFRHIHVIAATWPGAGWCQQSSGIAEKLDRRGREVIAKLAEHVLGFDELLAAARDAVEEDDGMACTDPLRAAIAKATGK